tara:strand:+ start:2930 stop:3649 length:720 start_codon:yes stop_codon:yes gene_type:complete
MNNFLSTMIPRDWRLFWNEEAKKPYLLELVTFLQKEYNEHVCYPPQHHVFKALEGLQADSVKCIILGQDPYHGFQQANGLAFSVSQGIKLPPSLRNIFKEYESDLSLPQPLHGDLNSWRKEGVLLLNTALTVREGKPGSHSKRGWEIFTSNLIKYILTKSTSVGFICLGTPANTLARTVSKELRQNELTIIHAPHPSPLSAYRGFFGSKPFTTFNKEQIKKGKEIVHWELPSNGQKSLF